jgi:hypothetical protein
MGTLSSSLRREPNALVGALRRGYEPRSFVSREDHFSFALSAVTIFLLSWYRARRPRQITDPRTGEVHAVPHDDAFMFIRMHYWTYVLAAAAVGLTVRAWLR